MKTCQACKQSNDDSSVYCMNCGAPVDQTTVVRGSKIPTSINQLINPAASAAKEVMNRYDKEAKRASSGFAEAISQINKQYFEDMISAKNSLEQKTAYFKDHLKKISDELELCAADWEDQKWQNFKPAPAKCVPIGTRLGISFFKGPFTEFHTPALIPILNQGNLFFLAKGPQKKKSIQALQAALFRLTSTFPPGKLRLILIDPIGLGANVAGFMSLPEQIIGNKAWTEPQHIEQQLSDLSAHMENVIQKYLRNDYSSMEEYNHQAGEVAEPYRFLGIINFPANFTDSSAKRLISIASNGPRAGVYLICTIDGDLPLPYGFNLPDLLRTGSLIDSSDTGEFIWKVPELDKLGLVLDTPPSPELFNHIITAVGNQAQSGDRVEVPFEKIIVPRSDWWKQDTSIGLRTPIGRKGARDLQYFELGQGIQHYGLMAGKPGSGKSTLIHVLITNLALIYPPEELVLYLVDFKKGVEFKDYAVFNLPHARVIGIESEREFGLSVLKEVEEEMNRRGDLFRKANFQDLDLYRQKTKHRLPRVFLIVDEFQRLFSEDDQLADQAANILAHIVQQGRAFGIHVLLASQTLADAYAVGRATYDKMNVRIALQCTEADSRLILGEENGAARLLSRPGEAVYNALNGREEGNSYFQVAWLPDDKREAYLREVRKMADEVNYIPPLPQVVFEGNIPSLLSSNTYLWDSIMSDHWPEKRGTVDLYLGESTEINPPHTTTCLRQQGRSNLIIIGQNEKTAYSLLSAISLSLAAKQHPENCQIFVVDFSRSDDHWASIFPRLKSILPHSINLGRPRDFLKTIGEIKEIVDCRIEVGEPGEKEVFLILAGLHRARELRDTDQYGSPGEASRIVSTICREGPDLGVHVICWCDTYGNFIRVLERRTISEFDIRVAMQMGEDDSNQYIESSKAITLGQNRAFLYDADHIGHIEKFRPYELLTETELDQIRSGMTIKIKR